MRPHRAHDFGLFRPAAAVSESQDGSVTTMAGLLRRHKDNTWWSADDDGTYRRQTASFWTVADTKRRFAVGNGPKNWPYNDANAAQHRHIAIPWPTADAGLMPRHSASVERQPLAQRDDTTNLRHGKNNIPSTYCRLVQNVLSRSTKSPTEPLP